jgi:hypothetical protein
MNPIFMKSRLAGAALVLSVTLAGCATSTPNFDAHFGEAVMAARAQQTINPRASLNTDPVSGIDGRAARDAMGQYRESFRTPPPTFNVINIGGGITGGSSQ